ncbi:MAG: hypothetical protein AAGF73_18965 [Actinomycetota bacterium]
MNRTSGWAIAGIIGTTVAIAGVGFLGAPTGAQTEALQLEPASQLADDGGPIGGAPQAPQVSDDGWIVVFEHDDGVVVRNREVDTTDVVDAAGRAPALSGDGCIVTYVVPGEPDGATGADPATELWAVDRCIEPAGPLVSEFVGSVAAMPPTLGTGALSADGSVAVWSTGSDVVRYVRSVDGGGIATWTLVDQFDVALDPTSDQTVGPDLAVSAAGLRIAFTADDQVYLWTRDDVAGTAEVVLLSAAANAQPATGTSGSPTISADGTLVAIDSTAPDLVPIAAVAATTPAVVLYDLADATAPIGRVLSDVATVPELAPDGGALLYQRDGVLRLLRSLDDEKGDDSRFAETDDSDLAASVGADIAGLVPVTGARIANAESAGGGNRAVVFDAPARDDLTQDARFHPEQQVWVHAVAVEQPPPPPTTPTTDAPPTTETTAPPDTTTTTAPPTTTGPTTTVPGSFIVPGDGETNPGVPLPGFDTIDGGAVVDNNGFPSTGSSSGSSSGSSGGSSSGSSTGSSGSNTTTSTTTTVQPTVQPDPLEFAPTILDAGRRIATAQVVGGTASVSVASVAITGSDDFTINDDACSGVTVSSGATCSIDVEFAPTTSGTLTAELMVRFSDGSSAVTSLTGTGATTPVLVAMPDVVVAGQVIALRGSGFPAGATVEWIVESSADAGAVVVDEEGSFVETIVVLPRTTAGPHTITIEGQDDLFGDVSAELIVGDRSDRSTAVRGQLGR